MGKLYSIEGLINQGNYTTADSQAQAKKNQRQRYFAAKRQEQEKRYDEQPTHKTAHLQAPTHPDFSSGQKSSFLADAPVEIGTFAFTDNDFKTG